MSTAETKAYQTVTLARERSIAVVTLNRPDKMNALNDQILYDLLDAIDQLERDKSVRAVILTGAGKAFCAGFDLAPRAVPFTTVEDWRDHAALGNAVCLKIWRSRLPVVAAVNGYCLGGGCDLSMVCDITVAAEHAEFGEPEIQFQSSPPFAIMPWVIGMKRAKELLLTGMRITATEAERIGLINRVVPAAQLMEEARKVAVQLAKVPPPAMVLNKRAINQSYEIGGFLSAIEYGAEMFALIQMSESDEQKEFFKIASEKGLKAAFKWRDKKFALDAEEAD